jgi:hypothetical protein
VKLSVVEKKLRKVSPYFLGEKHIPSIIRKLNAELNSSRIYFTSKRYDGGSFKDHSVIVSAEYCPHIMGIPEHVIVSLSFPKEQKKINLSKLGALNLEIKIMKTLFHEIRHKYQCKIKRKYTDGSYYSLPKTIHASDAPKLRYFGASDEIDAHAFETVVDIAYKKLNINRLKFAKKITWRESEAIYLYRRFFRENDPKVWKKFLKKVYKNNRGVSW